MKRPKYKLIPMDKIHAEARKIAVAWQSWKPGTTIMPDVAQRHKLASDIINFSRQFALDVHDGNFIFQVYYQTFTEHRTAIVIARTSTEAKQIFRRACDGVSPLFMEATKLGITHDGKRRIICIEDNDV